MDVKEFKILLKLLQKKNYESIPSGINPNNKTKTPETLKWCEQLFNRNFVELTKEMEKIGVTSTGKILIKQKQRPEVLTQVEWRLLQSFAQVNSLKLSEIKIKSLKAGQRNSLIEKAIARGFLKVVEEKIVRVTLTEAGKDFLATEYLPTAGNITISSQMLAAYLKLLRKHWQSKNNSVDLDSTKNINKPTDKEVLQTIVDLDKQLNTDNYLPIFHLRNKLQPPLTRDELNKALYRLQKQDKLSMDCLVKAAEYTPEQYDAGIPTDSAGPLFFIMLPLT